MEKEKRVRAQNYSESDKLLLLQIVEQYRSIIENKKTDSQSWKDKEEVWKKITQEHNAVCGSQRTTQSIKSCYDNLKKVTRKWLSDEKVNVYKTGGGPAGCRTMSKVQEQMLALMGATVQPLEARFDNDAPFNQLVEGALTQRSSCSGVPEGSNSMFEDQEIIVEDYVIDRDVVTNTDFLDLSSGCDVPKESLPGSSRHCTTLTSQSSLDLQSSSQSTPLKSSRSSDWSNYSISMLKTPTNQALLRRSTLPEISGLPSTSQQKLHNSQTSASLPSLKLANPVIAKPLSKTGKSSTQKPPISESVAKFEDLATAKAELVELQIEVLRSEAQRKKKMDEETYERKKLAEEEENKIKLEILKVELAIKQKILQQENEKWKKCVGIVQSITST